MDAPANTVSPTCQIRIAGVGGQGIVLASRLLGIAAALYDGKEAVCTQSYGPEARGGAARSDVIISDEVVDYPFVTEADILVALFPEAYAKFRTSLKPDGLLIVDDELVRTPEEEDAICRIPATRIARDLGNRLCSNVVVLGCLLARSGVVSREAMEQAIRTSLKQKIVPLNLQALEAGIQFATDGPAP